MKKVFTVFIVCTALLSFNACRTKDGAPGPAGANDLINQGSVSGTLYYLDFKGDSVKIPFNYQYYASLFQNEYEYNDSAIYKASYGQYPVGYSFNFKRRDLKDSADAFSFSVNYGQLDSKMNPVAPKNFTTGFSMIENLNNNIFDFSDYGGALSFVNDTATTYNYSTCFISNFSFDTLSGNLKFDFVKTYSPYDIAYSARYDNSKPAIIKGSVNVILVRKQPSIAYIKQQNAG